MTIENYKIGLQKNKANFAALTPISFLERTANIFPNYTSISSDTVIAKIREIEKEVKERSKEDIEKIRKEMENTFKIIADEVNKSNRDDFL